MKILIFSDTHLSDTFDEPKFNYLSRIIKQADQVIINGDFWDEHATTFDGFVNSHWKHLFPLLKSRKTVYIFGNHDKADQSNSQVDLFSDIQTEHYEFKSGNKKFIAEHGNKRVSIFGDKGIDETYDKHFLFIPFANEIHQTIIRLKWNTFLFRRYNNAVKKNFSSKLPNNTFFICGHTHCANIDLTRHFVNSGVNNFGLGQYVLIEDGAITAREEWYA